MSTVVDASIEGRLRTLEDSLAIERLMARYGECVDNSYDLDGMARILSSDLVWTSNALGSYEGLEAYLAGQSEISKGVAWAFHVMSPIKVTTAGDKADGTFYLLMLATFLRDGGKRVPIILSARYDNEFRREDGEWKCCRMNVQFHQVSPLTVGWVEEQFLP